MQGEQIDIEALFRRNELTQAIGNVNVNARGDELGPSGTIVKTREQKAREYYQKQKARKAADALPPQPPVVEEPVPEPAPIEPPKKVSKKADKQLDDLEGTEGV